MSPRNAQEYFAAAFAILEMRSGPAARTLHSIKTGKEMIPEGRTLPSADSVTQSTSESCKATPWKILVRGYGGEDTYLLINHSQLTPC
jgi:hypothetical protein